jgi:hypothetical protein
MLGSGIGSGTFSKSSWSRNFFKVKLDPEDPKPLEKVGSGSVTHGTVVSDSLNKNPEMLSSL